MKRIARQFLLTVLALGVVVAAGLRYIMGGEKASSSVIAVQIQLAAATPDGKSVGDVMRMMGVGNAVWTVEDGDWRGVEGKAFASCFMEDGTTEIFVWQWDVAWPHALALTPKTAAAFPLMDPGVALTPYGQSSLFSGKSAISTYFRGGSTPVAR